MDKRSRSWIKSITWRVVGVVILGAISYLFTQDWAATTWITIVFHSIRLILYYVHERLWERIDWGRKKHPLAHLPVRRKLTEEESRALKEVLEQRGLYGWQGESI